MLFLLQMIFSKKNDFDASKKNDFDASLVIPQDIPFFKTQDIDFLLSFQHTPKSVLIVPSRRFDGTNALFRTPVNIMRTHYDEDSYKIHLSTGKICNIPHFIGFCKENYDGY